jgi:hypothetical protein
MLRRSIFLKDNAKGSVETGGDDRVAKFLAQRGAGTVGGGRLIFALDATASRSPTWEMARSLTGEMIREAASIGPLSLQLVYFRGGLDAPRECVASAWTSDATRLAELMARVECRAGQTQIARVLAHAQRETLAAKVGAVTFIGDACEQPGDDFDRLGAAAVVLGRLKTPIFAFQEGREPSAEKAFRKIAEWSGGAYGRFDAGAATQLGDLLRAAAAFAVGGVTALEGRMDAGARLLLGQLKGGA